MKKLLLIAVIGCVQEVEAMMNKNDKKFEWSSIRSLYNYATNDIDTKCRVASESNCNRNDQSKKVSEKESCDWEKYVFFNNTSDEMLAIEDCLNLLSRDENKEKRIAAKHSLLIKQYFSLCCLESKLIPSVKKRLAKKMDKGWYNLRTKIHELRGDGQTDIRRAIQVKNEKGGVSLSRNRE